MTVLVGIFFGFIVWSDQHEHRRKAASMKRGALTRQWSRQLLPRQGESSSSFQGAPAAHCYVRRTRMEDKQQQWNDWIDAGGCKTNGTYIVLVWVIALLAANPKYVQLLPYFPLGLLAFFKYEPKGGETVIGWIGYLLLSLFCLYSRTRMRFLILLSVLTVVLILNVVGCRIVQPSLK